MLLFKMKILLIFIFFIELSRCQVVLSTQVDELIPTKINVKLFSKPNVESELIAVLKSDMLVNILDAKDRWIKVKTTSGDTGWFDIKSIVKEKSIEEPKTAKKNDSITREVSNPSKGDHYYVKSGRDLLSKPTLEGETVETLRAKSIVLGILEKRGYWIKVKVKSGNTGWLVDDWIEKEKSTKVVHIEKKRNPVKKKKLKNFKGED